MKHIHRYRRVNLSKTPGRKYPVYRCTLPDCNHYLTPELLVGKWGSCWRCGEKFIITGDLARLAKPHCKKCTREEEKPERVRVPDFMIPASLR